MNIEDLKRFELVLLQEYERKLHELRLKYVKENAEFKVGDFIGNVTGIIKVDSIGYERFRERFEITYTGLRYWWGKNKELKRTKDNKPSTLTYELKKIK